MLRQLSPQQWAQLETALPNERTRLRRIQNALAAKKRREKDDDGLLKQIEVCRRQMPHPTDRAAVRKVVATLPVVGGKERNGDETVLLDADRKISRGSAETLLLRKYQKHQEKIRRQVDCAESGRALAQQRVAPLLPPSDRLLQITLRLAHSAPGMGQRNLLAKAVRSFDMRGLPEAVEAFVQTAMDLIRRPRSS
jgi:hypothetical protein